MWFVSGVVMMYVGYPKLTSSERLVHLPALDATGLLGPHEALTAAGIEGPLKTLRLAAAQAGQPVYLAVPEQGAARPAGRRGPPPGAGTVVIDARTGQVLKTVDEQRALAGAQAFFGSGVPLAYEGTIDEDAFSHSRGLDAHRPLHIVQAADPEHTRLYVSGTTGEVVRDAPRAERLWNYAGAWIHWLYPFRGNLFNSYWTDIVNGLSIIGIAVAITGSVIGIMRWRFSGTYKSGSSSPYRGSMMRWHHISGLLFALITITWVFSGLMSMNPWQIFSNGAPPLRSEAMNGGKLVANPGDARPARLLAQTSLQVKELQWTQAAGQRVVLAYGATGGPITLNAATSLPFRFDTDAVRQAAAQLLPDRVAGVDVLTKYDTYYYAREPHTMTGGVDKPLPILRVRFDDTHQTWVHVDPVTASVVSRTDSTRRINRWLFAMLHSWDWLPLLDRRPLWDILLIVLSLGGTLLSLTGVVIGWKRLGRKLQPLALANSRSTR